VFNRHPYVVLQGRIGRLRDIDPFLFGIRAVLMILHIRDVRADGLDLLARREVFPFGPFEVDQNLVVRFVKLAGELLVKIRLGSKPIELPFGAH
jgi:hypothetical protein